MWQACYWLVVVVLEYCSWLNNKDSSNTSDVERFHSNIMAHTIPVLDKQGHSFESDCSGLIKQPYPTNGKHLVSYLTPFL